MINLWKILYNKRSANKNDWEPEWFGAKNFGGDLIDLIKEFQKRHDLDSDGLVGPKTFRRIATAREAMLDELDVSSDRSFIICGGRKVKIDWPKVVNMESSKAMSLPKNCYRRGRPKDPTMIVTHFDVCLSAKSCFRVLSRRGISSHFVIDNDGTIYQMMDTKDEGWHAGNRKVNRASIGVDISNAFYTKYQKIYVKRGHGERPILKNLKVHSGRIKECLGFYPVQIDAYKALLRSLNERYDIPLECPLDDKGNLLMTVHSDSSKARFKGVVNHFHLTRKKIDTVNLEMDKILKQIRDDKNSEN